MEINSVGGGVDGAEDFTLGVAGALKHGERLRRMTVGVGAASYPRDGKQYDEIIGAADLRMQRDKELRRRNAADADAKEP